MSKQVSCLYKFTDGIQSVIKVRLLYSHLFKQRQYRKYDVTYSHLFLVVLLLSVLRYSHYFF